ncbi:MAG: hypothetical protein WBB82_09650 [Limnothrix sp.]
MNLQTSIVGSIIGLLTIACAAQNPVEPVDVVIPVKGQCGEFSCEALFQLLQEQWPEQMAALPEECPIIASYGLNVWEDTDQKRVSLYCWQEQDETSVDPIFPNAAYGNFYRTFPYPGSENTFLARKDCLDDAACEAMWQKFETKYPDEMLAAQQTCAFHQGFLIYNQDEQRGLVDVSCAFFVPSVQIDNDGDGVSDGESKPTGVDIPLVSLPLENLNK